MIRPAMPDSGRAWMIAAAAAAVPAMLMPIGDPDLWWHLRAAGEIIHSGALPAAETWSRTMAGTPWTDFEWLSQLILYAVHAAGGLTGLWLLKAALLAGAGAALHRVLRLHQTPAYAHGAALALWAAAIIPRSDIRTELFSLVAFAWLFAALEQKRLGKSGFSTWLLAPAPLFAGFALWANLHAAFTYGLVLLGAYAIADSVDNKNYRLWKLVAIGAAASLANPYGWKLHGVLLAHMREAGAIQTYILEWAPLSLSRPGHWPALLLLLAAVALLARVGFGAGKTRGDEPPLAWPIALTVFALAAIRHARVGAFFCTLAVPLLCVLARHSGLRAAADKGRAAPWAAALMVLAAGFSMYAGSGAGVLRRVSHTVFTPVRAAAFLKENPDLAALNAYHPWGWGGYFGYMIPGFKVFQDGRYLFHPLLQEAGEAIRSVPGWAGFLAKYRTELAVMENQPLLFDTTRVYPDGSSRKFRRPYYLTFMPRAEWALIYFDDQALIFLRRGGLPPERLAALEYKLHRPRDGAALAEALDRGEIDTSLLERERARHQAELAALAVGVQRP